jgi:hypothetical protein
MKPDQENSKMLKQGAANGNCNYGGQRDAFSAFF